MAQWSREWMLMMMMMALHMAMVPMAVSAPVASMVCDVAQLPHARQGAAAAAWRGHVLVVAGSWAPNCTAPGPAVVHYSDVLINAADGSWDTLADMGVGNARTHHAIAVVGDHLYVLGGYGGAPHPHALDTVAMVDLSHPTQGAVAMPPIPDGAVTNAAAAPFANGFVLAGGFHYGASGRDGMSNSVWMFHPSNKSWETLPSMASARGAFALVSLPTIGAQALAAIGGVASVPGTGTFTNLATVERFDGESRAWSRLPSLPHGRGQIQAVVVGSRVLVVGGTNSTNDMCNQGASIFQRDVLALAIASSDGVLKERVAEWVKMTELPSPRGFVAVAVSRGDGVVVIGGINVSSIDCATVEEYNVTVNEWCHAK